MWRLARNPPATLRCGSVHYSTTIRTCGDLTQDDREVSGSEATNTIKPEDEAALDYIDRKPED
jgi:hypothetical protein